LTTRLTYSGGDSGLLGQQLLLGKRQKLLAIDRNVARGFDPQADFATVDIYDRDADIVTNEDLLSEFTAKYEHVASLL